MRGDWVQASDPNSRSASHRWPGSNMQTPSASPETTTDPECWSEKLRPDPQHSVFPQDPNISDLRHGLERETAVFIVYFCSLQLERLYCGEILPPAGYNWELQPRNTVARLIKLLLCRPGCNNYHITAKSRGIIHYQWQIQNGQCRYLDHTGWVRDMTCQTGSLPHIVHIFEVLKMVCLELEAYSGECLVYSHYFVLECKQRNENRVCWCHRCNSHQHSTAENSQSAFFYPAWLTEVFVCFAQWRQNWIKWFHFRSQENVDLLRAKNKHI